MGSQRLKRRRRRLWERNPRCRFCKRETVLPEDVPGLGDGKGKPPPNCATIEHLDGRYSERRGEVGGFDARPGLKERTVLCCWECNNLMNAAEEAQVPKEELWERSGGYPMGDPRNKDPKSRTLRATEDSRTETQ